MGEHELILAEIVIEETERALREKLRFSDAVIALNVAILRRLPVHPTAEAPEETPLFDPDDARILVSALATGAAVLVTGDRDILDVRDRIEGILIQTPREFWEATRGKGDHG